MQCRKNCTTDQITKLYFSEGNPENNLITELMEENTKLKTEAVESKSLNLQLQNENLKLSEHLDDTKKNFTIIERNF